MDYKRIEQAQYRLRQHPLTQRLSINCVDDLRVFMRNHVYAVWDFMCLTKQLQHHLAPSGSTWCPDYSAKARRWINEIVLGEESDISFDGHTHYSHFESYLIAMNELDIDTAWLQEWPHYVKSVGWTIALQHQLVPDPARYFMTQTKSFIDSDKPWIMCAALAFGREDLLPQQFQAILDQLEVLDIPSPTFRWYLQRHVEIDGNEHGPAARLLLEELCGTDEQKHAEATEAAIQAIAARERYWNLLIQENFNI